MRSLHLIHVLCSEIRGWLQISHVRKRHGSKLEAQSEHRGARSSRLRVSKSPHRIQNSGKMKSTAICRKAATFFFVIYSFTGSTSVLLLKGILKPLISNERKCDLNLSLNCIEKLESLTRDSFMNSTSHTKKPRLCWQ